MTENSHHSSLSFPPSLPPSLPPSFQAREEEVIGAVDPSLYDTVIGAYRQQGSFEKAMDLCDEMR
jgi:pentatricopeptide repeat protein